MPTVRAYLLWLVLACLFPGVIGASALFAYQYRQTQAQIEETTLHTARALVQAVDNHLMMAQAVAEVLSSNDALREGKLAQFHAQAREAVRQVGHGTHVVLHDRAGRQLLNTAVDFVQPLAPKPAPGQVRAVFETGRPVVSDLFFDPVLRRLLLSVEMPVVVDGQVRYALGVGILPEQFDALLQRQGLPPDWITSIVDRRGVIVARTHASEKFEGRMSSQALVDQLKLRPESGGTGSTLEGTEVHVFFSSSPLTGWRVAIGIPRQAAEAVFAQTASRMAAGIALLFALGTLVAWRIGGTLSTGFDSLTRAAQALGAGQPPTLRRPAIHEADQVAQALRRASTLLEERAQSLREEARRKDEFIAVLAHELRNPLAPVRTGVEIIKRIDSLEPRQRRACEAIERQVAHMARLIDDLLDVSRIARGKLALQPGRCDLAAVAAQSASDYRESIEVLGLSLAVETHDAPLWVQGDPVRLAQMVGNLLSNAGRFTERGGHITVRISADEGRHKARVCVHDTGVGIAPQLLARLFDPFSQAGQDLARSKGGLGLGLALTRGLARLHGGDVEAASEGEGRGATFTVAIPLLAAPDAEPREAPPSRGLADLASQDPPAAQVCTGAALRVLIVEDNEDSARSLGDLLGLAGYEVMLAFDGESGCSVAQAQAPDVVISDLGLPGAIDGYALAGRLRASPALAGIRLIALSGYADAASRERSLRAGFDAHIAKPADLPLLEATIRAR